MIVKRKAFTEDIPALRHIWATVFAEDSEASRDWFLETFIDYAWLAETDGKPISMVFGLPATVCGKPLQYIYAAATLPAYRGGGVFGELLRFVLEQARRDGCVGSFLHPAEPSLTSYYARFGYRPCTACAVEEGIAKAGECITPLTAEEYARRRAALLPTEAIDWDERLFAYAAQYASMYAVGESVALCYAIEDCLYVKEWLGADDPAALCAALGCTRYRKVTPADSGEPYVLLLPFGDDPPAAPYVGPVWD